MLAEHADLVCEPPVALVKEEEVSVAAAAKADDEPAGLGTMGSTSTAVDLKDADFVMYQYKVVDCPLQHEEEGAVSTHDWTQCPFAHSGEKARRRCPQQHSYVSVACPDFRKGSCKRGNSCPFAHGVFESWLHPAKFRTQSCKDGRDCTRKICFFAHSEQEMRTVAPEQLPVIAPAPRSSSSCAPATTPGGANSRSATVSCSYNSSYNSSSPISVQSSADSFFANMSPGGPLAGLDLSREASQESLSAAAVAAVGRGGHSPDVKLVQAMTSLANRLGRMKVAPAPPTHNGAAMPPRASTSSLGSASSLHNVPTMPMAGSMPMSRTLSGHPLLSSVSPLESPCVLSPALHHISSDGSYPMLSPSQTPPYSPALSPPPHATSRLAVLQQLAANHQALAQQQAIALQQAQHALALQQHVAMTAGMDAGPHGNSGLLDAQSLLMGPAGGQGLDMSASNSGFVPGFDAGLLGQVLAKSGVPPASAAHLLMAAHAAASVAVVQKQQQESAALLAAATGATGLWSQASAGSGPPSPDLTSVLMAGMDLIAPQNPAANAGTWDALRTMMQLQRHPVAGHGMHPN